MSDNQKPVFPEWPQHGDAEREGLLRTLESGNWWRMTGSEVENFEQEFADYHGAPHALAVTNGTHALELALEVLGAGPGTEVIVPGFTFISSSQAAQANFERVAGQLEAALARRDQDVKAAMAVYLADGVSDRYAAMEAQWNAAGTEVKGIIAAIRNSLSENDDVALRALQQAASYIPG